MAEAESSGLRGARGRLKQASPKEEYRRLISSLHPDHLDAKAVILLESQYSTRTSIIQKCLESRISRLRYP